MYTPQSADGMIEGGGTAYEGIHTDALMRRSRHGGHEGKERDAVDCFYEKDSGCDGDVYDKGRGMKDEKVYL